MMEEAYPEAADVLREAGWKPHDTWGVYTHGTLVMGSPREGEFRIKNVAKCPDSPDTPDDPVEAARWLVAKEIAPASEPEETRAHEAHEEAGISSASESNAGEGLGDAGPVGGSDESEHPIAECEPLSPESRGGELLVAEIGGDDDGLILGDEILLDADYADPIDLLTADSDFAEVALEPEHPSGAFIFGDNLEQKRTAAIGLVVQEALSRMPAAIDYQRLSALRNFTMGVSEGRWPDDPAQREELDTLEATERLRRAVEACRDAKVAELLGAGREALEAYDFEAGWP